MRTFVVVLIASDALYHLKGRAIVRRALGIPA